MSDLVKVEETWDEEEPNKKNVISDSTDTSGTCSPSSEEIKTEKLNSFYFGGSNFYSTEFEHKLKRSLPFMKSQPKKKRYLSDWSLNTDIFQGYQESSGSSPEAEPHQTSPEPEPMKKQRNLRKNNNDKKRRNTGDENGWKCTYCGNSYTRQSILSRHVKGVHFKKFHCPQCSKAFGCSYDVKRHLRGCRSSNNLEDSNTLYNGSEDVNHLKSLEESYISSEMKQDTEESNTERTHRKNDIIVREAPLDLSKNQMKIWKCEICEKSYSKREILQDHIRGIHMGQFKCERCLKSFGNNYSLDRHKKWNKCGEVMNVGQDSVVPVRIGLRKKMEFRCEFCDNTSTRAHDLKRHTMRMHLRCTDCSGTFSDRRQGEEHHKQQACNKRRISDETTNSSSEVNQSTETDCSRLEDSKNSSLLEPKEIKKWKCFVCEEYYTNGFTLQRHINGVHFKAFSCKNCSTDFSSKAALKRHKCVSSQDNVEPVQKVKSTKMDSCVTNSNELSIQSVSIGPTEDQPLAKEDLEATVPAFNPAVLRTLLFVQQMKMLMEFQRKTSLAAHFEQTSDVEVHHDEDKAPHKQPVQVLPAQEINSDTQADTSGQPAESKYSCASCSEIFTDKLVLANHYKNNHINSKKHECAECHKTFPRKDGLLRHVESKHLQVKHQCSECPMSFKNKFYLEDHVRGIHKQCQTFDCKFCDKRFPLKSTFYRHVYSVHGKKKWPCQVCQKELKSKHALERHAEAMH